MFLQTDYFNRQVASEDNTGYNVVPYGFFTYRHMSDDLTFYFNINEIVKKGIVSTLYPVFTTSSDLNSHFLRAYLNYSKRFASYCVLQKQGGSRTYMYFKKLCAHNAVIPSYKEQNKLATFIDLLDRKIKLQEELIEAFKKYKRGLSNALFDSLLAKEESQLCIFGDMMTILQNNTFSRDDLFDGGDGVRDIHYGDVLIKYGASLSLDDVNIPIIKPDRDIAKFSESSYLKSGDIVFADTAEDYTVGKATEIIGAANVTALSGLHTIPCRAKESFVPMYLGYYFNSDYFKKQLYPMIQGTKVSSIGKGEIIKTKIITPCQEEQARIASILSALDDRIDAAEAITKELALIRRGLLQQLFI